MQLSPSAHTDTFCRDNLPPDGQWPDLDLSIAGLAYPDRLNAADELLDATIAVHGPDRRCLLSPEGTWSYGDVAARASQIARVLTEDLGLVPGNRVLLRGPNNPWLAACWLGVLKAGGVAVATMPMLRTAELTNICEIAQVQLALCDHRFTAELAAVPGVGIITFGGDDAADLAALAAAKPGTFASVPTAGDDVAMIAFTSGTTGRPKAAMHFHRDLLATCDTYSRLVLRPGPDDLFTGTPPLAFTFGLGALLLFPLRAGAATLLLEKATPAELADAIAAYGVTIVSTAPTAYRAMLAAGKADQLRGLRRPVSAGEHLPRSTFDSFYAATGVQIVDGIGSTEMLHIFVSATPGQIRAGSTGTEVPGYRAVILDAEGKPVPDGEPGRLAVKGPTGCRYLNDPRQQQYVQDGWNITGDTYVRDADGLLLVPGAVRRHDHLRRLQHRRPGDRGSAAQPSGRRRVRGRRRAGRGPRAAGQGVRDPEGRRRRRRRQGQGAAGPGEGADRAVQVPARDRVRHRAAAHQHRQAAAVPAARAVIPWRPDATCADAASLYVNMSSHPRGRKPR